MCFLVFSAGLVPTCKTFGVNCLSAQCCILRTSSVTINHTARTFGLFTREVIDTLYTHILYARHIWIQHILLDTNEVRSKFLPIYSCLLELYKILTATVIRSIQDNTVQVSHKNGEIITTYKVRFGFAIGSFIHPTKGLLFQFEVVVLFVNGSFFSGYSFGDGYECPHFWNRPRDQCQGYKYPDAPEYRGYASRWAEPDSTEESEQKIWQSTSSIEEACVMAIKGGNMKESSANPRGGSSNVGEGWSSVNKLSPVNTPPEGMCNEPGQSVNLPPRYTLGTSDKLNYQEPKEVINKLYTDMSPHNDSQGKSDNKKEDIKHQEGDNLKLNLTPDNSSCQHPDGKSLDIRYKERKEVLHKLYMDTTPSHKDNNSTSHSHNKYIKHNSTVHVQDPLTSHYPQGQDKKQEQATHYTTLTNLWRRTTCAHLHIANWHYAATKQYSTMTRSNLQNHNRLPLYRTTNAWSRTISRTRFRRRRTSRRIQIKLPTKKLSMRQWEMR